MKYARVLALAGAAVYLTGCASTPRTVVVTPVGPAPAGVSQKTGDGSLLIFSARARANVDVNTETWLWNNDYGKNAFLYEPAHSDYTIYTRDGYVFKHVANASDPNDDMPAIVTLPAGLYQVEAQAIDCDSSRVNVLMPVVIKPGQTTLAHLEGDWRPEGEYGQTELATLPCGQPIGWRASERGFAGTP
jgi:hypothetical protein